VEQVVEVTRSTVHFQHSSAVPVCFCSMQQVEGVMHVMTATAARLLCVSVGSVVSMYNSGVASVSWRGVAGMDWCIGADVWCLVNG
jgi:hypothetical protein